MRYSYWLILLIIRDKWYQVFVIAKFVEIFSIYHIFKFVLKTSALFHPISIIFCYYIKDFFVLFVCCRDFEAGMKCIQTYTFDCMEEKQREHFNSLYVGTNKVVMELCQDGPYQDGKLYNYVILVVIPYQCNYGFVSRRF